MASYAGEVRIKTALDTTGINAGTKQITSALANIGAMASKLLGAVGITVGIAALAKLGQEGVKAAMQMESAQKSLQFLTNATGRSFQTANNFVQGFISDGLVPAADAYEAYKNMVARGYDTSQIEQMLNVMKDSAVYGRQAGFEIGEAIVKTSQGLRMENSILTDSVGIQKNVAKMWDEYAKSIGTTTNRLTDAQKRQAEFNGFMAEGGVYAGAAAQYTQSYAGRVSQLSAAFYNLKVSIGNAIIPILNAIIPSIINAVNWFTRLFNTVGKVMNLIFGTSVGMADVGSQAEGIGDAAGAMGDLADNTEAAGEAAKGALAPFDKLNVLEQKTGGGGGGGVGGGVGGVVPPADGGGLLPPAEQAGGLNAELDTLAAKLAEISAMIQNAFQEGDFSALGQQLSNGIIGALGKAREAVQNFDFEGLGTDAATGFNKVVSSVQTLFANIDFKTIGSEYGGLISDAIKGMLDTAIGFLQNVNWQEVGTTIWTGITSALEYVWGLITGADWGGIISRVFELLGSALGAAVGVIVGLGTAIWESLKTAWDTVKTKWGEFSDEAGGDIWGGIKDGIVSAATGIYEFFRDKVVKPFIEGFKKAFGIASPSTVMAEQGVDIIDGLKKGIEDAWNAAKGWFDEKIIAPLKGWFSEAWDSIKGFAADTWTEIEKVWTTVSTWFYDNVTEPVKTFFSDSWTDIKGFFTGTWDDVQLVWTTVSTWFYDNVTEPVKGFFSDAWGSISGFITGAWDDAKLVWDTVATWFTDNIITPVKTDFDTAFQEIKGFVESPFTNLETFVKGVFNGVIGFLNGLLTGLTSGINSVINALNGISFSIPDWVPLFGGQSFGVNLPNVSAPQIPLLATGAVIPANAPFATVLGDQRYGRNLEAPEALIRQIVREETGRLQTQVKVSFEGDLASLVRELKPHIDAETKRIGSSLIAKGATV